MYWLNFKTPLLSEPQLWYNMRRKPKTYTRVLSYHELRGSIIMRVAEFNTTGFRGNRSTHNRIAQMQIQEKACARASLSATHKETPAHQAFAPTLVYKILPETGNKVTVVKEVH